MGLKAASEVRDSPINLTYQEAKHYSQIFKSFDKDKDGHISIHDLRRALQDMEVKVSDNELRDLIAEVDINKNCTIEEEEFLQVRVFFCFVLFWRWGKKKGCVKGDLGRMWHIH